MPRKPSCIGHRTEFGLLLVSLFLPRVGRRASTVVILSFFLSGRRASSRRTRNARVKRMQHLQKRASVLISVLFPFHVHFHVHFHGARCRPFIRLRHEICNAPCVLPLDLCTLNSFSSPRCPSVPVHDCPLPNQNGFGRPCKDLGRKLALLALGPGTVPGPTAACGPPTPYVTVPIAQVAPLAFASICLFSEGGKGLRGLVDPRAVLAPAARALPWSPSHCRPPTSNHFLLFCATPGRLWAPDGLGWFFLCLFTLGHLVSFVSLLPVFSVITFCHSLHR